MSAPNVARVAALIGDRARAAMLNELMCGRALTATELCRAADITKQTGSAHLKRLVDGQLVAVEAHGRHRYFRIANEEVAHVLEGLAGIAHETRAVRHDSGPRDPNLRKARICYDHLAGEVAVTIYDSLRRRNAFRLDDGEIDLSDEGSRIFAAFEIDLDELRKQRRVLCRACMDWSERRHHLAGALGSALLRRFVDLRWARQERPSRIVRITPQGLRWVASLAVTPA
jgi:DNA-binding transcriptional ArsR family regulator